MFKEFREKAVVHSTAVALVLVLAFASSDALAKKISSYDEITVNGVSASENSCLLGYYASPNHGYLNFSGSTVQETLPGRTQSEAREYLDRTLPQLIAAKAKAKDRFGIDGYSMMIAVLKSAQANLDVVWGACEQSQQTGRSVWLQ